MDDTSDALDVGLLRFSSGATIGTGGFIDTPNQRLLVNHELPIVTPGDLAKVAVKGSGANAVRLGDVADLTIGTQALSGDAVVNGGPGLLMIVEKYPWGNTLQVTRDVDKAVKELQPGLPGVTIDTHIFRAANFIDVSIDNLTRALLIGALLVILVLFVFLFEWRTALISTIAIPLSLTAAGLVLYWRGDTINVMVLAGLVIALGVVVDDAIIDIENIWRRLRQSRAAGDDIPVAKVIVEASLEVRSSIVYATMIILLSLIPIYLLSGLTGTFFRPLVLSYGLAVGASLLVALTITPALSMLLLSRAPLRRYDPPLVAWLKRGYGWLLARVIHRPRPAYLVVVLTVLAGLAVVPSLGESLVPTFKERNFLGHFITKPGTSLTEETRMIERAQRDLKAVPGVQHVGTHIGQAFLADEIAGVNFGEDWIAVDPNANYEKTVAQIQAVVDKYPGAFHDVQTYLNERIDEVLTGSSDPIVIRIFGNDLNVLRQRADEVRDRHLADQRHSRPVRRVPGRRRAGTGHGEARRGAALRPQAGRCPPGGRHDDGERGSRRHLPRRARLRRARVEHSARRVSSMTQPAQPAARHPGRRPRGHARRGEHQDRADAERDPPRGRLEEHRHLRGRRGTRPRRRCRRRHGAARRTSTSRSATTPSCSASTRSARTRSTT